MLENENNIDIDGANLPPVLPIPRGHDRLCGMTRATIYKKLAAGEISAVKNGKRTLIVTASLIANLRSLPKAEFGKKAATISN